MSMQIERARAEDAETIWTVRSNALRTQCAGHYEAELLAAWANSSAPKGFAKTVADTFHVIRDDERVVACGLILLETGSIEALFVDPTAFGKGYGRALLQHMQTLAQQHGLQRLTLNASLNAVGFYRTCGFTGETPNKHHSPSGFEIDCVAMEKRLT
jgi:N-acetylglutamate synthase-like GNAT family acetyltransferase